MKVKIQILFFIYMCFSSGNIIADSDNINDTLYFEKTSRNPHMEGYFTSMMDSVHLGIFLSSKPACVFGDYAMYIRNLDFEQIVAYFGGMIPIVKNVAIPLFGGINSGGSNSEDESYNQLGYIVGGGILIHGRYGLLSGYVGYSSNEYGYLSDENNKIEEKWHWAVYPMINAKEYPILNSFASLISGYFRMDRDFFQSTYKANIIFRDIPLLDDYIKITLSTYTIKDWYNIDTKYDLYAGKINLTFTFPERWYFPLFTESIFISAEGGYREFFDIVRNINLYETGGYIKLSIGLFTKGDNDLGKAGFYFYYESGTKPFFKDSVFGILGGWIINPKTLTRFNLNMVFPKESENNDFFGYSMSGRWHPDIFDDDDDDW